MYTYTPHSNARLFFYTLFAQCNLLVSTNQMNTKKRINVLTLLLW